MASEFKTPFVPEGIRNLRCKSYKNIFEYNLGNRNLFGTETLCGDWDGDLLIVAEDFAPTSVIEDRLKVGDLDPYRHNPSAPTNKNIIRRLKENGRKVEIDGTGNISCGVLYMSACFFLRTDGERSGELPNQTECKRQSSPVFEFTIGEMPNLEKIACLGKFAFEFVEDYFNCFAVGWRDCMNSREPILVGDWLIFAHTHPAWPNNRLLGASGEKCEDAIREDWRSMLRHRLPRRR